MIHPTARRWGLRGVTLWGAAVALFAACGGRPEDPALHDVRLAQPLAARCTVNVIGVGEVDVETDYLPHVVQCENGAADFEALKAQAVAARSYLYYRLATGDGTIVDGQRDQVYSCSRVPTLEHIRAVEETAGEVLMYQETPVAAFYVAGAIPSQRDSCISLPGDVDYSNTEQYVTPNWELIGDGVEQTTLGWIHPANYANRGCKSQNGAHCLAEAGWNYEDILLFYYGADIQHVAATGACTVPTGLPHGCGRVVPSAEGSALYPVTDACFVRGCPGPVDWEIVPGDAGGEAWAATPHANRDDACLGRWRLSFAEAGTYAVDVQVPAGAGATQRARYVVVAAGVRSVVEVALPEAGGFVHLGDFAFAAGAFQGVERTTAMADSPGADVTDRVIFDTLRVRGLVPPARGDAGESDAHTGGAPDAGGDGEDRGGTPGGSGDLDPPAPGEWTARVATWRPTPATGTSGPDDRPSAAQPAQSGFSCAQGNGPAASLALVAALPCWLTLRRRARRRGP